LKSPAWPPEIEAAMTEAVRFFEYCRQHGFWPDGEQARVSIFRPRRNRKELLDLYDNDLAALFGMVREGDVEADLVLRQYILNEAKEGPLTGLKHDILGWLLLMPRPEPPASRGRQELRDRNFLIATAVKRITSFGFAATRNRAGTADSTSACQIIAMALTKLGMPKTERAVEDIWVNNKREVEERGFVPLE
jgi:hypothetical protein